MENPKKAKLPVIITGVLFAVSLILLCVLLALQLSGDKDKKGNDNESGVPFETNESAAESSPFSNIKETDESQSEAATGNKTGCYRRCW